MSGNRDYSVVAVEGSPVVDPSTAAGSAVVARDASGNAFSGSIATATEAAVAAGVSAGASAR